MKWKNLAMEKYNAGIILSDDGTVKNKLGEIITPLKDINGYSVIPDELLTLSRPSGKIKLNNGNFVYGKYLHRMIVYSFGDCKGNAYNTDLVIDHLDMNHSNNAVSNLEQVSKGRNLFRAYLKTRSPGTKEEFEKYYSTVSIGEKIILDFEIQEDMIEIYISEKNKDKWK